MSKPLITEYQKAKTVLDEELEVLNEEQKASEEALKEAEEKAERKLIDEVLRR